MMRIFDDFLVLINGYIVNLEYLSHRVSPSEMYSKFFKIAFFSIIIYMLS